MVKLNRKIVGFSLVILVILIAGDHFISRESDEGRSSITLIIRFGEYGKTFAQNTTVWKDGFLISSETSKENTTIYEFHELAGENQTVFSALLLASDWGNFTVEYSNHKFPKGVFIESIAEVRNGVSQWQYDLNGEYGNRASDAVLVTDNDVLEWIYK